MSHDDGELTQDMLDEAIKVFNRLKKEERQREMTRGGDDGIDSGSSQQT